MDCGAPLVMAPSCYRTVWNALLGLAGREYSWRVSSGSKPRRYLQRSLVSLWARTRTWNSRVQVVPHRTFAIQPFYQIRDTRTQCAQTVSHLNLARYPGTWVFFCPQSTSALGLGSHICQTPKEGMQLAWLGGQRSVVPSRINNGQDIAYCAVTLGT